MTRSIVLGLAVGLATIAVVYGLMASVFYTLAGVDAHGTDRPFFREGLVAIGLPVSILLGVLAGVIVGLWHRRGGHLPTDRTPF